MNLDDIAIEPGQSGSHGYNTGNIRSSEGGFKTYNSFESGIADQQRLLSDYQSKHGLATVRDIVNRWAPPKENNTSNYVNYMAKQLGVDPDEGINLSDPETMGKFSYAQSLMEKGSKNVPLSRDDFINIARNRGSKTDQKINLDDIAAMPSQASQEALGEVKPVNLDDIAQEPQNAATASTEAQQNQSVWLPTARAITGGAVNLANVPAEITDAFTSAASWVGGKLGVGDGTYTPASRVTTGDIEQGLSLEPGTLTPQSKWEKAGAAILPFMTPMGVEEAGEVAATKTGKVVNSLVSNLKQSALGSVAANSNKDDPVSIPVIRTIHF